jgi:hypothetical protein
MALDPARLSALIEQKFSGKVATREDPFRKALFESVAEGIVEELRANFELVISSLVAPPGTAGGPITSVGPDPSSTPPGSVK